MAKTYQPPKGAQNNAKKVLEWKEEHGNEVKAMTSTGWARARQLASGDPVSADTVKRMAAFARHRKNATVAPEYKDEPWKDKGYVAWLGWGGTTGVDWAIRTSETMEKSKGSSMSKGRKIMKEFTISEISAVDEPAQEPALVTITKSKKPYQQEDDDDMAKTPEELEKELAAEKARADKAEKEAEEMKAKADMTDDEKKAMDDMDEDEARKFLKMSKDKRAELIKAKGEADPVIFKSKAGDVFRQSDDPRLVEMAKRDDAREEELAKMRDDAATAAFEKSAATDFAKFKGDSKAKGLLAKAVAGIKSDEDRELVKSMLTDTHKSMGVMFTEVGATDTTEIEGLEESGDIKKAAGDKLDELAKAKAEADSISYEKAYAAVLGTPEGQKLYAKSA